MPGVTLDQIAEAFTEYRTSAESKLSRAENRINELEDRINMNASAGRNGGRPDHAAQNEALKGLHAWMAGRRNEMSAGSDPDGGYLVGSELAPMIEPVLRDVSAIRRLVTPVTLQEGDHYVDVFAWGGAVAEWVQEMQERDASETPDFYLINTWIRETHVQPVVTQRLLDLASFDVESFLREEVGEATGELEGAAFVNGDGIGKPRGFLTYNIVATSDATRAFGDIEYLPTGHASTLVADALRRLPLKLHPKYRRNGRWVMSSDTAAEVSLMKDGNGRYLWSDGLTEGQPDRLCGYPVEIDENMPGVDTNAYPIAFGDWQRAYRVVDHRTGIRILRDNITTKGRVKFYTTHLLGGGLRDSRAIKLLKIGES